MNKAECKRCQRMVVRERGSRRANNPKGFYYVNHESRLWNGRLCPDCNVKITHEYKTGVRVPDPSKKAVNKTGVVVKGKCRKCSQKLPPNRYFHHDHCLSQGHAAEGYYSAEDWGYGVSGLKGY